MPITGVICGVVENKKNKNNGDPGYKDKTDNKNTVHLNNEDPIRNDYHGKNENPPAAVINNYNKSDKDIQDYGIVEEKNITRKFQERKMML